MLLIGGCAAGKVSFHSQEPSPPRSLLSAKGSSNCFHAAPRRRIKQEHVGGEEAKKRLAMVLGRE